jgi:hypothetical protein
VAEDGGYAGNADEHAESIGDTLAWLLAVAKDQVGWKRSCL